MSALPLVALATWAGVVALMDLTTRKVRWWWLLLGMIGAGVLSPHRLGQTGI